MPISFVVCADLSPPHILPRDDDDDAYIPPVYLSTRTFIQRSGIVNIEAALKSNCCCVLVCVWGGMNVWGWAMRVGSRLDTCSTSFPGQELSNDSANELLTHNLWKATSRVQRCSGRAPDGPPSPVSSD
jgi:hypothetical protein